jgi:flagellar biosynthesis anti-sigma factor FlgM
MQGRTKYYTGKENMEFDSNNPSAVADSDVYGPVIHPMPHRSRMPDDGSPAADPGRIELFVRDREVSHLIELIQSAPDIREEKVLKIQRAIESGTYRVSAGQIADKIIGGNLVDNV